MVPARLARVAGDRGGQPVRSVPDISADADPVTGFAVGLLTFSRHEPPRYAQTPVGGTSESAPLVAGLVIAAQQGQRRSFGLINPVIYRLAGSAALHDPRPDNARSPRLWRGIVIPPVMFGVPTLTEFDDQSPDITAQVTLRGYDNMTGVGTPDGPRFIAALRRPGR